MSDLLLLLLIVGLHIYWIYALTTYTWTEEDNNVEWP